MASGHSGFLERIAWRALSAAALLFLLATGTAFAGSWDWRLDLLTNLRPHYLFGLAFLAAVFGIRRRRRWAGLCAVGAAVNLVLVAPVLLPHLATPPADAGRTLSVMALNVKVDAVAAEDLIAYLRGSDDDLVFLFAASARYAVALDSADIPHRVAVSRQPLTSLETILLARDPDAITTAVHWLEEDGDQSAGVEAIVDLPGTRVRVLGTHPESPLTPERAARRDRQLARLSAWASRHSEPVLIVGDLNATPWSHAFRSLLAEGGLVNSLGSVFGVHPSWPSPWHRLGIPIDHALHSPGLVTLERYLGPSLGSDHRALHVTVAPGLHR